MSRATQTIAGRAAVEGFPRIDRYFPECRIAAIEAVCRLLFGVRDFGKLYGRHTFKYSKPAGPIGFRANGVELDLELHRQYMHWTGQRSELDFLMEDVYGIRNEIETFVDFEAYRQACVEGIASGVPVVTNFDLGFLKQRREYGKIHSAHVIVLIGYDAQSRAVRAAEQMLGETDVDFDDFERCFEHRVRTDGAMRVWSVQRCGSAERELSRAEVSARIQANLDNLTSSDSGWGLAGLARFRSDLETYLESDAFTGRPFSVPGLWVFSHERHIERKWLKSIAGLCSDPKAIEALDQALSGLFKRWLGADYLIEKCLMSGDGRSLRGLPRHLTEIIKDEQRALDGWRAIRTLL